MYARCADVAGGGQLHRSQATDVSGPYTTTPAHTAPPVHVPDRWSSCGSAAMCWKHVQGAIGQDGLCYQQSKPLSRSKGPRARRLGVCALEVTCAMQPAPNAAATVSGGVSSAVRIDDRRPWYASCSLSKISGGFGSQKTAPCVASSMAVARSALIVSCPSCSCRGLGGSPNVTAHRRCSTYTTHRFTDRLAHGTCAHTNILGDILTSAPCTMMHLCVLLGSAHPLRGSLSCTLLYYTMVCACHR